jgi:hypothetical protein
MNRRETAFREREETPVDDVRRVRERFDREVGGDIHRLAELARQAMAKQGSRFGLKPARMPDSSVRMAFRKMRSRRK